MSLAHRSPEIWVIVVGGGSGQRFGAPKQFAILVAETGERVIDRSVGVAAAVADHVVVVVPPDLVDAERGRLERPTRVAPTDDAAHADSQHRDPRASITVVAGGATRAHSVANGLAMVPDGADVVCVHDAARPLATAQLYRDVIDAVRHGADGAVPGLAVVDTVKTIDADGVITGTPDRSSLVTVQTPQAFAANTLRRAHDRGDPAATDDAMLVEADGGRVRVVAGERSNLKITHPDDLDAARRAARGDGAPPEART